MDINLNQSLNTGIKTLVCNHCTFEFSNYNDMRDHYKSQFHLYNLHRVTMNLNPVSHEVFVQKKENLEKIKKSKEIPTNSNKSKISTENSSNYCDVCYKSFASHQKLSEHFSSKSHKLKTQKKEERKVSNDIISSEKVHPDEKSKKESPLKNYLICFACNNDTSVDLSQLIEHLKNNHQFEFPVKSLLTKPDKAIKLIIKKIFKFGACLYCDSDRFPSSKAIQSHMKDTGHVKINYEDIIEHFHKFYDKKNILNATDVEKKTKEYKLLKRIYGDRNKTNKEDEIEEVDEIDEKDVVDDLVVDINKVERQYDNTYNSFDEDEEIKEINFVNLDNGEIMLRNGTVIGNKIYKNAYKQRVKVNTLSTEVSKQAQISRLKARAHKREANRMNNMTEQFSGWKMKGSKKANFTRINTLHIVRKQVNC